MNFMPQHAQINHSKEVSTTVFVLTDDGPAFPVCLEALHKQERASFMLEVIHHVSSFSAAAEKTIMDCATELFILVDEDIILYPEAVAAMEAAMRRAPDDVGMICFHLFDEDRQTTNQGGKIYRTALLKGLACQDLKACEVDLLDYMEQRGIAWILHPGVMGRHGTQYTPETIYRRYKTMYEKDIRQWNVLTVDIRRKAEAYRDTGDPLQLFALLGAVHGIIHAPLAVTREKDTGTDEIAELNVFKRLFLEDAPPAQSYCVGRSAQPVYPPISFDLVQWKAGEGNAKKLDGGSAVVAISSRRKSARIAQLSFPDTE